MPQTDTKILSSTPLLCRPRGIVWDAACVTRPVGLRATYEGWRSGLHDCTICWPTVPNRMRLEVDHTVLKLKEIWVQVEAWLLVEEHGRLPDQPLGSFTVLKLHHELFKERHAHMFFEVGSWARREYEVPFSVGFGLPNSGEQLCLEEDSRPCC